MFMNELLGFIQNLDTTMNAQMVATLAGLSIAAASFLATSTSDLQRERDTIIDSLGRLKVANPGKNDDQRARLIDEETLRLEQAEQRLQKAKKAVAGMHASSIAFILGLVESLTLDPLDKVAGLNAFISLHLIQVVDVAVYSLLLGVGVCKLISATNNMAKLNDAV